MEKPFTQLKLSEAQRGLAMEGAYLRWTPEELTQRLGITFQIEQDDLGPMDAALIASDGKQFGLMRLLQAPNPRYTALLINEKTLDVTGDVCDGLEALGIDSSEVIAFHLDYRPERHVLWRQDDHGRQFVVGEYTCRSDVANVLRRLTAYQHKQMYWVEKK